MFMKACGRYLNSSLTINWKQFRNYDGVLNRGKQMLFTGVLCFVCFGAALSGYSQDRSGTRGQHVTSNDKTTFMSGANYIPSTGWYFVLENWNPEAVERDMAALHKLGITSIRFPPLWVLVQPEIETVNQTELTRLNQFLTIAHRNGIGVQVEFLTGGICGAVFVPKWADGDIFNDPKIIGGERRLVREIVHSVKDNPGLLGYDFGNEIDYLRRMMHLNPTQEQIRQWMATIYQAAHDADPRHPVTTGLGTIHGNGEPFNIWDSAEASDYMTLHSYAFFDNTIKHDPWIGQRTLYDMNYGIAYAAMTGKPVLVQENGFSEGWIGNKDEIAKCLRLSLMSAWAQGATGYFWWGSHDNDTNYRIPTKYIALKHSQPSLAAGIMKELEYSEGLLDTENQPKPYGLEYQRWNTVISKLGSGWKNDLPVLYLLYPDHQVKDFPDKPQLTAFTLAKQVHMEVRMWPEWKPIPADAAAVVIANFGLSSKGKTVISQYLENGGVVYQSWVNDFLGDHNPTSGGTTVSSPTFIASIPEQGIPRRNHLPISEGDRIRVNAKLKLVDVTAPLPPDTRVLLTAPAGPPEKGNRPVFVETAVGKGTYYYLAANLEEALADTYNPWDADDSNQIYSVLQREGSVSIDSKYVELFAKSRGSERLILLLNRSNRFQDVLLRSPQSIQLRDYTTHVQLGAGKEIPLRLTPGEVVVADINGR